MLKIIIFVALFATVTPSLEKIYGEWILTMLYPEVNMMPICMKYEILKDPDVECICNGERNATFIKLRLGALNYEGLHTEEDSNPFMEVTDVSEVAGVLNTTCICKEKSFESCGAVRSINNDHFLLYGKEKAYNYTETEKNNVLLLGRNVETTNDIQNLVQNDEELKNRKGVIVCAEEYLNTPL